MPDSSWFSPLLTVLQYYLDKEYISLYANSHNIKNAWKYALIQKSTELQAALMTACREIENHIWHFQQNNFEGIYTVFTVASTEPQILAFKI